MVNKLKKCIANILNFFRIESVYGEYFINVQLEWIYSMVRSCVSLFYINAISNKLISGFSAYEICTLGPMSNAIFHFINWFFFVDISTSTEVHFIGCCLLNIACIQTNVFIAFGGLANFRTLSGVWQQHFGLQFVCVKWLFDGMCSWFSDLSDRNRIILLYIYVSQTCYCLWFLCCCWWYFQLYAIPSNK